MSRLRHQRIVAAVTMLTATMGYLALASPAAAASPPEPIAIGQASAGNLQVLGTDSDAVGTTVKLHQYAVGMPASVKAQRWTFEVIVPNNPPIYRVRHASSGRCLQAAYAANGSEVILVDCGTATQQWWTVARVQTHPTPAYSLRNRRDGRCLDLYHTSTGQPVATWDCSTNYGTQLWRNRVGGFDCPEREEVGICVREDEPAFGLMINFRQQPVSFNGPPSDPQTGPGYNELSNQVNWDPLDSTNGDPGSDNVEMGWRGAYTANTGSTSHGAYWLEAGQNTEEFHAINRPDSTLADGSVHTWMSLGSDTGQWDILYDFNPVGSSRLAAGNRTKQFESGMLVRHDEYATLATPFENRIQLMNGNELWRRPRLVDMAGFPTNICGQPDPHAIAAGKPNTPPYCFTTGHIPRASNLPSSPAELDRIVLGKPAVGTLTADRTTPAVPLAAGKDVHNGVDQRALAACLAIDPSACLGTVPGLTACVQARMICNVTSRATADGATAQQSITADTARHRAAVALRHDQASSTRVTTTNAADFTRRSNAPLNGLDPAATVYVVTGASTVNSLSSRRERSYQGFTAVYSTAGDVLYACLGQQCPRKEFS